MSFDQLFDGSDQHLFEPREKPIRLCMSCKIKWGFSRGNLKSRSCPKCNSDPFLTMNASDIGTHIHMESKNLSLSDFEEWNNNAPNAKVQRIELLKFGSRKSLRIDWSNDRHQGIQLKKMMRKVLLPHLLKCYIFSRWRKRVEKYNGKIVLTQATPPNCIYR